jgi:hypothetical protein
LDSPTSGPVYVRRRLDLRHRQNALLIYGVTMLNVGAKSSCMSGSIVIAGDEARDRVISISASGDDQQTGHDGDGGDSRLHDSPRTREKRSVAEILQILNECGPDRAPGRRTDAGGLHLRDSD